MTLVNHEVTQAIVKALVTSHVVGLASIFICGSCAMTEIVQDLMPGPQFFSSYNNHLRSSIL